LNERPFVTEQQGFTLVEMMLAMLILTSALVLTGGVLVAAQSFSQSTLEWGNRAEQLRMAIGQLGEDITYGQWSGVPPSTDQFRLTAYQPKLDTTGWNTGWTAEGWPGWLTQARTLSVLYTLEDDQLIREVSDGLSPTKVYSRQVLASGLIPNTAVDYPSYFEVAVSGAKRTVLATLNTYRQRVQPTGGNDVEQATGKWHIR